MKYIFLVLLNLVFLIGAAAPSNKIEIVPSESLPLMEVIDKRNVFEKFRRQAGANFWMVGNALQNSLTKWKIYFRPHHNNIFLNPVLSAVTNEFVYPIAFPPENDGLYLFIHGWKGLPHYFHPYILNVKRKNPSMLCYAPHILAEGNCTLEEAARPLLALIQDYAHQHPGKPIVLIGTSNGGRIAMYLESQLTVEELKDREFSLVSLAGVHYGTQFINYLAGYKLLWTTFMHEEMVKDFHWQSKTAVTCLDLWREKQQVWKEHGIMVRHFFAATTEDGQVYPLSCSLPQSPPSTTPCTYRVYPGENHLSIVPAACRDVLHWLNNYYP